MKELNLALNWGEREIEVKIDSALVFPWFKSCESESGIKR